MPYMWEGTHHPPKEERKEPYLQGNIRVVWAASHLRHEPESFRGSPTATSCKRKRVVFSYISLSKNDVHRLHTQDDECTDVNVCVR